MPAAARTLQPRRDAKYGLLGKGVFTSRVQPSSICGSELFRETTKKHSLVKDSHDATGATIKAKPIPGNAGATFFATLEYEAKLRAGVSLGDEDEDVPERCNDLVAVPQLALAPFRSARGTASDPVVLLHTTNGNEKHVDRLLTGYQKRWEDLGAPRKPKDIAKEFEALAAGGLSTRQLRPQTPRELKEQARRGEALARIKALTGGSRSGGPACGRRSQVTLQHTLAAMNVVPTVMSAEQRAHWTFGAKPIRAAAADARDATSSEPVFPFGPPKRGGEEDGEEEGEEEEPSEEQRKADELRAMAAALNGELTPEQVATKLAARKEECQLRVMTPDDWRCKTSAVTSTKPTVWQWTGVAGALAAEDPSEVKREDSRYSKGEDPRYSERDITLTELCDSADLDLEVLRRATARASASEWSKPDHNGRTALHAICQNSCLKRQALELILESAPYEAWHVHNSSEHQGTPLHFLCGNQSSFSCEVLRSFVARVADPLPLLSRRRGAARLWAAQDENGLTPLHELCSNSLGPVEEAPQPDVDTSRTKCLAHRSAARELFDLHAEVKLQPQAEAEMRRLFPRAKLGHSSYNKDQRDWEFIKLRVIRALAHHQSVEEAVASAQKELKAAGEALADGEELAAVSTCQCTHAICRCLGFPDWP